MNPVLRRMIVPAIFGLAGAGILIGLGTWQLQRLEWKQGVLAEISAKIHAGPVPLPPDAAPHPYLPVRAEGRFTGEMLRVLVSRKMIGPGYRVIAVFETPVAHAPGHGASEAGARRVLVDLGFLPDGEALLPPQGTAVVTGNLHIPDEVDSFTPDPDRAKGLWFARDVPAMARALETEPVLIVAREDIVDGIEAMPVDTALIANNHLGYAITWFSLAACWLGMTVLFLWRIRRRT